VKIWGIKGFEGGANDTDFFADETSKKSLQIKSQG
jgi:hypothetical protein